MNEIKIKAAHQLDELIAYFHMMYDESMENVAAYDLNGRMVYINPTLKKTLEVNSAEEHEKLRGTQAAPFHSVFSAIHHVIETGQATQFFLSAPNTFASRAIQDQIYVSPVRNQQGNIIAVTTIGRNMNYAEAQRLAEDKQHATYLRALLDTFPFMVWMKDKDGHFLEVNQKLSEVANEPEPKHLLGKTDFDCFPQEMAQGYVDDDNEVLKSGLSKIVEEKIQKADGSTYWAETYKSPVEIDGEIIGTVGFARDITERKHLIAEINEKSAAYMSLIEHLPMTIIRYNTDCRRVFIKDEFKDRHKGHLNFECGLSPEEQWHPNIVNMTGAEYTQHLRQVINTGLTCDFEIKTQVGDGTHISIVKLVPEYDSAHRITGALAIVQDTTQSYRDQEKIRHLAYYDSITQLPNRSYFNQQLAEKLENAKNTKQAIAVLIVDLDYFKSINDTLGHDVGDILLFKVSEKIKSALSADALLARLGGDEFAILLENYADGKQIASLAKNIVNALSEPIFIEHKELSVTASIGIASYPKHAETCTDLLKFADTAMYVAKKEGRNNYQFFVSDINESNAYAHIVRTELRHAAENNQLYLEYQPIYDLKTQQLTKFEALLRWQHPKLGTVEPGRFIPIAEEFGLITEIGNWVLKQAIADAVKFNAASQSPVKFAVNLSPQQFVRNNLFNCVQQHLSASGLAPQLLELEITEGLLLNNSVDVVTTLQTLADLGIAITIDDFGIGYSSLAYLSRFPISSIKIDKSFVRDIETDPKDAALIKAIITLGNSLDKSVTAEGIETEAQRQFAQSWGCQLGQGFLLGRPRRLAFILEDIEYENRSYR